MMVLLGKLIPSCLSLCVTFYPGCHVFSFFKKKVRSVFLHFPRLASAKNVSQLIISHQTLATKTQTEVNGWNQAKLSVPFWRSPFGRYANTWMHASLVKTAEEHLPWVPIWYCRHFEPSCQLPQALNDDVETKNGFLISLSFYQISQRCIVVYCLTGAPLKVWIHARGSTNEILQMGAVNSHQTGCRIPVNKIIITQHNYS